MAQDPLDLIKIRFRLYISGGAGMALFFSWPSLFGELYRYKNPTHHVSRLEIPLWAFGVHIVTIGTPLRQGFIGVECLKDASPALGCHPCIGTIGIHEDLRKRSPLELCRWAILFVYRPTADQPVSNPIWLCSHEPPRFE